MAIHPTVLSPATPSELLGFIISHCRYPTTLVIGCSKEDFLATLVNDVKKDIHQPSTQEGEPPDATPKEYDHALLRAPSLFQIAVSRHIRLVFTPTVTHFRAWMSTFSPNDSKIPAPPNHKPDSRAPLLIVYGLLELHRDASEWSAQGVGNSVAISVNSVANTAFELVILEPRGAGGHESFEQLLEEQLPLLNGASRKGDGSWSGRTVTVQRTLGRWCAFEFRDWDPIQQ